MMNEAAPIMLSIRNALRVAGLGRTKLYELAGRGLVRAVKADGKTLIDAQSLRDYLDGLPRAPIKPMRMHPKKPRNADRGTSAPGRT
jgi:hypothetical protein